ncbi:MAG: protein TolR [Proteobacteria bacterium]|nr:protein TolR [Pseudomonadota bacterium]
MPLRSKYKKRKTIAEINVVPYIDVMLVLLVIFMIAAPLLSQGINVSLPQASAKPLPLKPEPPIIVSVDKNGKLYLNVSDQPKMPLSVQSLMVQVAAQLTVAKQKNQTRDVYVKGDRSVDYGKVVEVMVMLQKAGVENVGLLTEPL